MFDIGAAELLVIVVVAVLVIGPKDMPVAMRTAGRWMGKVRRVSNHFRSGVDAMIREAEMEGMEKTWKERNAQIMAQDTAKDGEAPADTPQMMPLPPGEPVQTDTSGAAAMPSEPAAQTTADDGHAEDDRRKLSNG